VFCEAGRNPGGAGARHHPRGVAVTPAPPEPVRMLRRPAGLPLPDGIRSQVAKAYRDWFAATWSSRYETATPYPWTQLGYTYDWGSSNHMGLSEYVIRKGSTVGVAGVWDPLAYFTPLPQ
jgi:hypothetical protein